MAPEVGLGNLLMCNVLYSLLSARSQRLSASFRDFPLVAVSVAILDFFIGIVFRFEFSCFSLFRLERLVEDSEALFFLRKHVQNTR